MKPLFLVISLAIVFSACHLKQFTADQFDSKNQLIDSTPVQNEKLEKFVEPYKQSFHKTMSETLQISDTPLTKARPESLLGNFFADACFAYAMEYSDTASLKPDLAIFNTGGLRTSLPKGNITRGKIFELMPFENELVLVNISGQKLKEGLSYILEKGGEPIANAQFIFDNQLITSATINNQAFDTLKNYTVLTSDYLAFGGDKMMFFKDPIEYKSLNIKIRDALIEYLINSRKKGQFISPTLDGRIQIN